LKSMTAHFSMPANARTVTNFATLSTICISPHQVEPETPHKCFHHTWIPIPPNHLNLFSIVDLKIPSSSTQIIEKEQHMQSKGFPSVPILEKLQPEFRVLCAKKRVQPESASPQD
jgi:hypothetical protein